MKNAFASFFLLLGMYSMHTALAQSADDSFTLKEGMKLHYKINGEMDFTVQIKELGDHVKFTWFKGNVKGFDVLLTSKAMDQADVQLNHIYGMTGMPPQKYDHATSVFFSRKLFRELDDDDIITCYPYADGYETPVEVAKLTDDVYEVVNLTTGDTIQIPMLVAEGENQEMFYIMKDDDYPLILHQYLDFMISLVGIEE